MKDVAKHANVAIGTVDRVLNHTGYVSDEKIQAVMSAVEYLGYVPNRAASALSKQKNLTICILYPDVESYFWDMIHKGIKRAERRYGPYGLKVIIKHSESYDFHAQKIFLESMADENDFDGLALVPLHPTMLNPIINRLHDNGIPVVTFDSDAPTSKRFCFIGEDSLKGGKIAGKLLGLFMGKKGKIAVLRGQANLLAIQQRITGFLEVIGGQFPEIEVVQFYDMYENNLQPGGKISHIIDDIVKNSCVDGIFVTNILVGDVGRTIFERNIANIPIVGFDYSYEIDSLIRNNTISAVVSTDLENLGYLIVKTLYDYIAKETHVDHPEKHLISEFEIKIRESVEDNLLI